MHCISKDSKQTQPVTDRSKHLTEKKNNPVSALILVLCSLIWGTAFVSQSVGAQYVGAFTFLTFRCWVAVLFLIPAGSLILRVRSGGRNRIRDEFGRKRKTYLTGGIICGTALFLASAAQQIGIGYTTTAKAGFITALYVILVPILSIFLGRIPSPRIWFCVVLGTAGLYFLCMAGNTEGLNRGDLILMLCAFLFSIQILAVNRFAPVTDGILLSLSQTFIEALLATAAMLLFEKPDAAALRAAMPSILYAGVLSSGVAYTLQMVGQKGTEPTVASLIMCLESVFSAAAGWLILGERLSSTELFGCALMFSAIAVSQIPGVSLRRRHGA